jgi:hypothetical protein
MQQVVRYAPWNRLRVDHWVDALPRGGPAANGLKNIALEKDASWTTFRKAPSDGVTKQSVRHRGGRRIELAPTAG